MNLLDRAKNRFVLVVALACSVSLAPIQPVDSSEPVGSGQPVRAVSGAETRSPMRLPNVVRLTAGLAERQNTESPSESVRKTKMAFERLEFQTSDDVSNRRDPANLQERSVESSESELHLGDGFSTLPSQGLTGEVRSLRSNSASACANKARHLIDQAMLEYATSAWLSAEATAWEALRSAAEGIDLANREIAKVHLGVSNRDAIKRLQAARIAIREARDFSGVYGIADGEAISRMAISHTTDVLDDLPCDNLSGNDASDRYLDAARVSLAGIASKSVEAAHSMDLLAAIYLQQGDSKKLHGATALCLRRAALQGQPANASLASRLGMHLLDIGLIDEASWTLKHSLSLEKDEATTRAYIAVLQQSGRQAEAKQVSDKLQPVLGSIVTSDPRIPTVEQLSPRQFAAISKPVMTASVGNRTNASMVSSKGPVATQTQLVTTRKNESVDPNVVPQYGEDPETASKPNVLQRFIGSVKRFW